MNLNFNAFKNIISIHSKKLCKGMLEGKTILRLKFQIKLILENLAKIKK